MRLSPIARASVAGACHALGGVWIVAGVLRTIFGVAVTFPLLPPVDLARVAPGPSLIVGAAFIVFGAWLSRGVRRTAALPDAIPGARGAGDAISAGAPEWTASAPAQPTPIGVRTPPA